MRKLITILAQGSTRFNISKKEIMKLNIDIPTIKEQQIIIKFLGNFDKIINIQSDKIKKLKQRKNGLLQNMFM